ncbi:unnamed protein product [Haemonchus placei]|uniref:Astacin domain-containing protein n=1 Tax=Haemonchus placei TaxID=6290 RepID=A0A0N4X487_HAEPC|nr:unnamed protein product [Haemonchus placei]
MKFLKAATVVHEFMHALGVQHMHMRSDRDKFLKVNLTYVNAPAGKKIQIRVMKLTNVQCRNGCTVSAIEPKLMASKAITNRRFCCDADLNTIRTSNISPMPVIAYTSDNGKVMVMPWCFYVYLYVAYAPVELQLSTLLCTVILLEWKKLSSDFSNIINGKKQAVIGAALNLNWEKTDNF